MNNLSRWFTCFYEFIAIHMVNSLHCYTFSQRTRQRQVKRQNLKLTDKHNTYINKTTLKQTHLNNHKTDRNYSLHSCSCLSKVLLLGVEAEDPDSLRILDLLVIEGDAVKGDVPKRKASSPPSGCVWVL